MKSKLRWSMISCAVPLALAGCDGEQGGERPSPNPPPSWGAPISGGTLLITRDGTQAVVGDPDRDRLVVVDLRSDVSLELALEKGDEPGRLVEDGAGRVHVALRRGGALVTLDATRSRVVERRAVCGEPRGVAWDAAREAIHVACAGGELVTLPAGGGAATRALRLERDLRDVMVSGSQLLVSKFRSAELLTIDAQGAVTARQASPVTHRLATSSQLGPGGPIAPPPDGEIPRVDAVPSVAWRTVALPGGGYLMSHQRVVKGELETGRPGGYDVGCGSGPVETALTVLRPGQAPVAVHPLVRGALPVDVAVNTSGSRIAVALAGAQGIHLLSSDALGRPDDKDCPGRPDAEPDEPVILSWLTTDQLGAPTSVAWTPADDLVAYYPELPALVVRGGAELKTRRVISLPGELGYDSGRALFHRQTGSGLACASCHPEALEDGQVWEFAELGPRRTQSLAGGILSRGPYHWEGDMADLAVLMDDVLSKRMSGGAVTRSEKLSLGPWLDRIPAPAPVAPATAAGAAAVARGQALFESPAVGCASCHGGAQLTSNARLAVGTGGLFKVPSLRGVAARPPFLHDGCAPTLRDRFGACGGGDQHGATSQLSAAQLDDLLAYLESL